MSDFDDRTQANMDVALHRACDGLATGKENHETRKFIAKRIIDCAKNGRRSLGELTLAAQQAASELTLSKPRNSASLAHNPVSGRRRQTEAGHIERLSSAVDQTPFVDPLIKNAIAPSGGVPNSRR